MTRKTMWTLSACAVASVAAVRLQRLIRQWRLTHLNFDFPIEEQLFIGWGGAHPRRFSKS